MKDVGKRSYDEHRAVMNERTRCFLPAVKMKLDGACVCPCTTYVCSLKATAGGKLHRSHYIRKVDVEESR